MNASTDTHAGAGHQAPVTWSRRAAEMAAVVVFLSCVGAVAQHTRSLKPVTGTTAYHEHLARTIESAPREIREWVGVDVPIPVQAQNLLRPTAFLSRQYVNRATGESCVVTIVHCGDARDMLDHYPPNCYPGQGWILQRAKPAEFKLSVGTVQATNYEFARGRFGVSTLAAVTNAMILPNGTTDREMAGVERAMSTPALRNLGVAQVQVFFDQAIPEARRQAIAGEMLEGHAACIAAIARTTSLSQE
jgi:hypothetical protein